MLSAVGVQPRQLVLLITICSGPNESCCVFRSARSVPEFRQNLSARGDDIDAIPQHLLAWQKSPAAFADISFVAGGQKRGFGRLARTSRLLPI
jgi:hypothetical protein